VRLLLGAGVEEVVSAGSQVVGVRTGDGELVRADMVLVGIGVLPNVDIATRCGLAVDNGIVVDEQLLTADRRISAVGDCASYPSGIGDARHRLESVQNAIDHGRMVAARLAGGRTEPGVPWFWTHQFGHKLQIAGVAPDRGLTAVRGRPSAGRFSVFNFDSTGRLRAVESVNQAAEHLAARRALKARLPISPEQAADPDFDFIAASRNAATSVGA
jgi:3-phenylpropionate/trans-cinnamate dioxygenase ferredoxin reductase subunit